MQPRRQDAALCRTTLIHLPPLENGLVQALIAFAQCVSGELSKPEEVCVYHKISWNNG